MQDLENNDGNGGAVGEGLKLQEERRPSRLQTFLPLIAIVVVCNLSGGGECSWTGSTDHSRNPSPAMLLAGEEEVPTPGGPYRLETYQIDDEAPAGIPSIRNIKDISLERAGIDEVSAAHLHEFAEHVLEVNDDLLGLAEHAGALVFVKVVALEERSLAVYGHVMQDRHGSLAPVPGSLLAFAFDSNGRLLEILSTIHWRE